MLLKLESLAQPSLRYLPHAMQTSGLRDTHTQIQPANRTGSMNQYTNSDGKREETVSEAAVSPGRIPYPHLLDLELKDEEKADGKWPLYHTPTGRLTGFLRERHKYNCAEQKEPGRKSPWKPPYTSPMHGPMETQHPIGTDAPTHVHKRGSVVNSSDMAVKTSEATSQNFIHTTHNARVSDFTSQCTTCNQLRRTSTVGGSSHARRSSSPGTLLENEQTCLRGREMLKEGTEMRLKALALAKRNDVSRQECQEQVLEYRYLQFVSEVTRDIMSRSVLSRPALDLLCQMHINKHKHSLREDEMMRRLDELKTRIGIP